MIHSNLVIEKLRRNLKAKGIERLIELFPDSADSQTTNIIEFKNAMKRVGISAKETDRIMEILATNSEGLLDLGILNKKIVKLE
jgi:hypothetical protein